MPEHISPVTSLNRGLEVISNYVKNLPLKPGVYRMLGKNDTVLYVGKAKSLKKRVQSYTQPQRLPNRLKRMISETISMEFVITHNEIEALLLEATLIKNLNPRYNVLFKDSKSFAYILITEGQWPRLGKHRGAKNIPGKYYGPFASTEAVHQTINSLHKIFKLRNCSDSYFAARKRPCLQYHIKRCTAPCVRYINEEDYNTSVRQAKDFLEGKSQLLQKELSEKMLAASAKRDYEHASFYRDQIRALTQIQVHQNMNPTFKESTDIIALAEDKGSVAIQIFFFRNSSHFGSRTYFPLHTDETSPEDVLTSFLTQFYNDHQPPELVLINYDLEDKNLLQNAFHEKYGHSVTFLKPLKGEKKKLIERTYENACEALERHLAEASTLKSILEKLTEVFQLPNIPERIEIYDNSHIQGSNAVGAMVVASRKGFETKLYRKFTIKTAGPSGITPGDDFGMMREVLTRRFSGSLLKKVENTLPDLILIDGGKGQLSTAHSVLDELNLDIPILAIAKGPERNAGKETFFKKGSHPITLERHRPILHYLERLRDEAHRFAIGTHRKKREKALTLSPLDEISGIGAERKKILLRHFGSTRNIENAGLEDLKKVNGISAALANKIYDFFHP